MHRKELFGAIGELVAEDFGFDPGASLQYSEVQTGKVRRLLDKLDLPNGPACSLEQFPGGFYFKFGGASMEVVIDALKRMNATAKAVGVTPGRHEAHRGFRR